MRIATVRQPDGRWAVVDLDTDRQVLSTHADRARAMVAGAALWRRETPLTAAADGTVPPPDGGTPFYAIVAFQGVETDDGRLFRELTFRGMPLPLWCQFENLDGHDGAVIVGRFDTMTTLADGMTVTGEGWYDGSEDAQRAIKQAREKTNYGISMDGTGSHYPDYECMEYDEASGWCNRERTVYPTAMIVSATQVATPAFAGASISLDAMPTYTPTPAGDPPPIPDGVEQDLLEWFFFNTERTEAATAPHAGIAAQHRANLDALRAEFGPDGERLQIVEASTDCGCDEPLTAAAVLAPVDPPAAWFDDPQLAGPTPMTVTDDGRIVGHVATWDTCHVGFPDSCTIAPRSASGYAYFHTGVVRTAEGVDVQCGTLTMNTGHASLAADPRQTAAHYDDTGTGVADVRLGEDEHGIWMAGAVRTGLTEDQARVLRASAPSGDWRRIGTGLEMVAVLAVNVPGFPTPRAALAAAAVPDGQPVAQALVAAGSPSLVEMAREPWRVEVAALSVKLATVEAALAPLLPLAHARLRARV